MSKSLFTSARFCQTSRDVAENPVRTTNSFWSFSVCEYRQCQASPPPPPRCRHPTLSAILQAELKKKAMLLAAIDGRSGGADSLRPQRERYFLPATTWRPWMTYSTFRRIISTNHKFPRKKNKIRPTHTTSTGRKCYFSLQYWRRSPVFPSSPLSPLPEGGSPPVRSSCARLSSSCRTYQQNGPHIAAVMESQT